ncbi:MAG: hypothetical protein K8T25_13715 [Planctomycetia bacterium]|nr:hypothetical protein [Planctomycetia bacterium]
MNRSTIAAALIGAWALAGAWSTAQAQPPAGPRPPARPAPATGATPPAAVPAGPAGPALPEFVELRFIPESNIAQFRKLQFAVKRLIIKKPLEDDTEEMFDNYFRFYYLPQLTQVQNLPESAKLREELMNFFREAAKRKHPQIAEKLHDIVLSEMMIVFWRVEVAPADPPEFREIPANLVVKRAAPVRNFHPAARVSAMLVVGQLNEKMDWNAAEHVFEVQPSLLALRALTDAVADPSFPAAVQSAALIGIRRHVAEGKMAAGSKDLVISTLLKAAENGPVPPGQSPEARAWIRRQALDVLVNCAPDVTEPQRQKLATMGADINDSIAQRLTAGLAHARAAEALWRNHQDKVHPGVSVETAKTLANLAVEAGDFELSPTTPKQPPFSRPRLASTWGIILESLGGKPALDGQLDPKSTAKLEGICALAASNEQPYVRGLCNRISTMWNQCGDAKLGDDAALREALTNGLNELKEFISAGPEAALGKEQAVPAGGPPMVPAAAAPMSDPFKVPDVPKKK